MLQPSAQQRALSPLHQSCRKAHGVSGSVSASPCVSQKDTLSFKFYGSYLWLKYHLWQFPSAKLQKWYSLTAKGCYWGPKLQAKSCMESECTWTPSHRKPVSSKYVHFLDTRARGVCQGPTCGGSWLPVDQSKKLDSCSPHRSDPVSYSKQESRRPASSVILWQL